MFDDIRAFARGNTVTMSPTVAGNSVSPTTAIHNDGIHSQQLSGEKKYEKIEKIV